MAMKKRLLVDDLAPPVGSENAPFPAPMAGQYKSNKLTFLCKNRNSLLNCHEKQRAADERREPYNVADFPTPLLEDNIHLLGPAG